MNNIFKKLSKPILENNPANKFEEIQVRLETPIQSKPDSSPHLQKYFDKLNEDLKYLEEEDIIIKKKKMIQPPTIWKPIINDDIFFWEIIDKIEWKDKSEGEIDFTVYNGKIRRFMISDDSRRKFHELLNKYIEELREIYKKYNHDIFNRPIDDQDAFFSHIIAKGQVYYITMKEDPAFSLYLLDPVEFQDFRKCLQ